MHIDPGELAFWPGHFVHLSEPIYGDSAFYLLQQDSIMSAGLAENELA